MSLRQKIEQIISLYVEGNNTDNVLICHEPFFFDTRLFFKGAE